MDKHSDIQQLNLSKLEKVLEYVRVEPLQHHDTIHLIFDGYNSDPREIFEIEEIRAWVEKLVLTYPDILYYLEAKLHGLQNIILCLSEVEYMAATQETDVLLHAVLSDQLVDAMYIKLHELIMSSNYPPLMTDTMIRLVPFTNQHIKAINHEQAGSEIES